MARAQMVERAKAILEFVIAYKREHDGISPTIREIQDFTGIRSTSLVKFYLGYLEEGGKIRMLGDNRSRGIMVTGGAWRHE